jgi:hypothetical protein
MHATSGFVGPAQSTMKRMFLVQENIVFLGGAVLFSLAFASPIPLLGCGAAELLWLALGSKSVGVRRWLERRDAVLRTAPDERPVAVPVSTLAPEYARRVLTLDRALATMRGFGGGRPPPSFERAMTRLDTLRLSYAALCETHQRIGRFLAGTTEAQLVAETERLKNQFSAEKDLGTRLTLRQAIGAAQRHIEHRRNMAQLQQSIGVKLDSVERSLAFLVSQGLALVSHAALSDEVEALLGEVGPPLDIEVEAPPESVPGLATG